MLLAALGVIGDLLSANSHDAPARLRARAPDRAAARHAAVALRARRPATTGAAADDGRPRAGQRTEEREAREGMTPPSVTVDREGTVTGNTYDKYGSTNPVVKRLMAGFEATLDELFVQGRAGVAARRRLRRGRADRTSGRSASTGRVVGIDLDDPQLHAEWEQRQAPNLEYQRDEGREPAVRRRRVRRRARRSRCSSTCPTPSTRSPRWRASRRGHLLVSVPREPLWRGLNMARGAYWKDLGQHARPPEPLVEAQLRAAAVQARRGRRGTLAVPVDDAARACRLG